MTNEQREAVERLRKGIDDILFATLYRQEEMNTDIDTVLALIKEQQEELDKKDKQIDLMARAFKQDDVRTVEEIKQYFADLVEKES